jgi:hypothetical protein
MKEGTKYALIFLGGLISYFLIYYFATPLLSVYRGFAPLDAQAFHEGVTSIVISIILLGVVICCCTHEIIKAFKK